MLALLVVSPRCLIKASMKTLGVDWIDVVFGLELGRNLSDLKLRLSDSCSLTVLSSRDFRHRQLIYEEVARKDATQIVANLQRQQVHSRLIACDYLEANIDLMDISASGYENPDMALHYGAMLRECIRHQSVARYVLESQHMKKFFDFIQLPNFDIAADAAATFKGIMDLYMDTVPLISISAERRLWNCMEFQKSKLNYRAWNHRCWLVSYVPKTQVIDELVNHRDWAGLHVADNSCFHYRTMKAILRKDKCLAAIDERSAEVTDDSKWDEMDGNAIANLHLALADGVLSSIEEKKSAKEI
ncbi:putative MO25-like protein [Tanacetum coccineum]